MKNPTAKTQKKPPNRALIIGISCLFLVCAVAYGVYQWLDIDQLRNVLTGFLERAQDTPFALLFVCLAYLAGGAVMFPVMVLNLAVAMVFGALWGTIYSLTGAMLSAVVFFGLGRYIRQRGFQNILKHPRIHRVDQALKNSGVIGIALLRMIPMAPYSVFNVAAGVSTLNFLEYCAGTFLALLPGSIARGIVGGSLTSLILNPTRESMLWLGGGLILWAAIMAGSHFLLKKYRH